MPHTSGPRLPWWELVASFSNLSARDRRRFVGAIVAEWLPRVLPAPWRGRFLGLLLGAAAAEIAWHLLPSR